MEQKINPVYQYAKEIIETTELKETTQLLQTGKWVATCAVEKKDGTVMFSLMRVI